MTSAFGTLGQRIGSSEPILPASNPCELAFLTEAAYYSPAKPQRSYVDRLISSSFASMMFIVMGLATIALGVLVFSHPALAERDGPRAHPFTAGFVRGTGRVRPTPANGTPSLRTYRMAPFHFAYFFLRYA